MDILFEDDDLKSVCEQERLAKRKFGLKGFKKLRARLADIAAARCVTDLVAGRPHPLKGDLEGFLALDLDGPMRLLLAPPEPVPRLRDGSIDWSEVTSVIVADIKDYHD